MSTLRQREKVLVLARDGLWCRAAKKTDLYEETPTKTLCDKWIAFPTAFEKETVSRRTTCPDCFRIEKAAKS